MTDSKADHSNSDTTTPVILVVEDEKIVRTLLVQTLQENGYSVLEAADGQAALELCERADCTIDIVVTDIVMPRMSGPEFAARLASVIPGTKVIYMSAYADNASVRRAPGAEAGYLQKPFGPDALLARVREVLASAATRPEAPAGERREPRSRST